MNKGQQYPKYWKFDHDEAVRLYQSGMSTVEIGKRLGIAPNNVWRTLKIAGVPLRSISDSVSLASRNDRHTVNGYVTVSVGKYDRRLEHVMVAEKAIGRKLKQGEHVHHINGVRNDNRNENLLICSREYHTELHWRMRSHPYWSKDFGSLSSLELSK